MRRFESGRRLHTSGSVNPLLGWTSFLSPLETSDSSAALTHSRRSAVVGVPPLEHLQARSVVFGGLDPNRLRRHGYRALPFGAEPIWETARWQSKVDSSRSLRQQIARGVNRGISCQVEPAHPGLLVEMELCRESWLSRLGCPQFRHDTEYNIEAAVLHGTILTARQSGRLVGWLIAMPMAEEKMLLAPICRTPSSPQGTVEVLVDAAMRWSLECGAAEVSMGVIPFADSALQQCPAALRPLLRVIKQKAIGYRYAGVENFRRKLRPDRWQSRWVAWPRQMSLICAVSAFAELLYGTGLSGALIAELLTSHGS